MSGAPEVSVVVPTHNRSHLLRETLRSVLWQRDADFEVVVVDDGSRDDTAEVLARLADARVRTVRHHTPKGVSAARNRGLAEASGEWVAFCDDDDLWAPDKLARQLVAARQAARAWVYAGAVNVDLRGRVHGGSPPPTPERLLEALPRWNPMPGGCSNVVARRDCLARSGGFDPDLRILADWELWLRLARIGSPACVRSPLVGYRVHGANMSLDTRRMLAELDIVSRLDGTDVDRAGFSRHIGRLCLRAGRRREAYRYLAAAALRGSTAQRRMHGRADARLVRDDLTEAVRRRTRLPPGRRAAARQRRAAETDAYAAW
ncbi:MAG: glycosyltransferase, partial [Euzebyales bacterium]|nr:glycosyltransferase [Euzebyales bacterium]